MTKDQEKRLTDLSASSVVGGDLRAALAEIKMLRDMERQYAQQLGEMARLCDVVCGGVLAFEESENFHQLFVAEEIAAAREIMDYVDAVSPAAGSKDPEWVMHVVGPDDVIPMPSQFAALKAANDHNKAFAKLMADDPSPNNPYCVALAKNSAEEEV